MRTHTKHVSKNIAISDDVYRRLKREKGDRSFSEVIAAHLESGGTVADVTGQQVLDSETADRVKEDIETLSEGTLDRLDE
jgi:predicted CopG family antitoxin